MTILNPLAFAMPQGAEWLVILALGLLIFGKRLPEVGKGIGQAISKFKQGLNSTDDEVEQVAPDAARQLNAGANTAAVRKFDPYTGKPLEAEAATAS